MANDHPFQTLFETLGRNPAAHAEPVNRQAYEILADILTVPVEKSGRCILLRAPRAGHGKTHLLSRIQHYLGSTHEFIPLHPAFGCRIDASSVTDDALRRLVRPLPASGGLCVLDLVTRRLFASALQPLVGSGEVPCQDREGALAALRTRPIETFDFHHPNAVTAHWARENFEVLGQRLSLELAQRCTLPVREVAFWVDALFRFAATPVENAGRVRALAESAHSGNPTEGESMERLEALLGLLSLLMRVVLVADDLEGFSADETAALRLAAFLGSLRQSVERLDVILSLNQDIWQSAFVPRLSGGLADRLSEVVIELEPLTESEMVALLDSRVPGLGGRVLDRIDVGSAGTHARGLIRAAGMAWLKATAMDSANSPAPVAPPAATVPPFSPPPVVEKVITPEPEPVIEPPQAESVAQASEPVVAESPIAEASPFSAFVDPAPAVTETAVAWPAPEFSPAKSAETAPEPAFQPVDDSPFQTSSSEPVGQSFAPPEWQNGPQFTSEPAPIQEFNPPPVESQFQPVDSPFPYAPPVFTPQPSALAFNPPAPEPVAAFPPQMDSPFQAAPPVFTPEPPQAPQSQNFTPSYGAESAPIFAAPSQPVEPTPPPATSDTDRVDDLLRQFRERYGRGSL